MFTEQMKGQKPGRVSTVKKDFLHIKQNARGLCCCSVWVTVSIAVRLLHIDAELILLVTAHVCVTHEVQGVVVNAHCWCNKVQFHLWGGEEWVLCKFKRKYSFSLESRGSSLTFAFCWRVSLLIEIRLLDLGSPITTHQPSSRFCNNRGNTCREDYHTHYTDV